jgi:hypothetical protein
MEELLQILDKNKTAGAYELFRNYKKIPDTPLTVFKFIIWMNVPWWVIWELIKEDHTKEQLYVTDACANRFTALHDSVEHQDALLKIIDLKHKNRYWYLFKVWLFAALSISICVPIWFGKAIFKGIKGIIFGT